MVIGFLLAAYSVTANDSLQTLGSYLSSNEHRTPKGVQMMFVCTMTAIVLMGGWFINNGEPAWGRLTSFPQPACFTWAYLIPPIAVLALTAWGAPVSTSFLVLSAFEPGNIGTLVERSVSGYLLALSLGLAVWGRGVALLERLFNANHQPRADTNSAQQLSPEYNLGFSRIARRPRDCPGVETTISRTRRFNTSYCSAQQKSEPRHLESGSWPDREPDDRCGHSATDRPHNQLSTH